MKAMVLAAGLGTRLRPLTNELPKPLFPVMNRPVLEHTIDLLKSAGIEDIAVNLHHLGDKVEEHFGDGTRFGVRLHYSREKTILGTAGGIKAAQKYLDGDAFIVINSDVVTDIDLEKLIRFHKEKNSCLTLALKEGNSTKRFDPIKIDGAGRVVHFASASIGNSSDMAFRFTFTGIQIVEPEIFDRIPAGKFLGTTESVYPNMVEEGLPVYGFIHDGYWIDIGQREDYLQAHKDFFSGKIASEKIDLSGSPRGSNIQPPVLIGPDCMISETARIGPNVVLGKGCHVEDGAVAENSVCMDGAVIKKGAVAIESIIGSGAVIAEEKRLHQQLIA